MNLFLLVGDQSNRSPPKKKPLLVKKETPSKFYISIFFFIYTNLISIIIQIVYYYCINLFYHKDPNLKILDKVFWIIIIYLEIAKNVKEKVTSNRQKFNLRKNILYHNA